MRYPITTLLALTALAAVAVTAWLRTSQLEEELRAALQLPIESRLTIVDASNDQCVIAVSTVGEQATLFAAFRELCDTANWHVPIAAASGATVDRAENIIEWRREFKRFPTDVEIDAFRDEFGLRW